MADFDAPTRDYAAEDERLRAAQVKLAAPDAAGRASQLEEWVATLSAEERAQIAAMLAASEAAPPEVTASSPATAVPEATLSLTPAPPMARDHETVDHWPTPTPHGSGSVWLTPPAAPRVPDDGARFRELRALSAGGIGEVTVALDQQIHREVAVKKLLGDGHDDPVKRTRFELEGQVTGALEHPGVAPVYALGLDGSRRPYFAMRLIRGESLREAIRVYHKATGPAHWTRRDGQFRDLVRRLADVCVTVAYAHSRGILHRDLKPDNVMLGKYGETYVVDWGMARVVGTRAEAGSLPSEELIRPAEWTAESETRHGSAMGTPGYMSPEQATGQLEKLTAATDVYSLGATLYCLLTNGAPIAAKSLADFLAKVTAGDFPGPRDLNPSAPAPLAAICLKAMAPAPLERYASARDMAADLERWLADEPVSAATETLLERAGRFARKNYRWLAPLGAAVTLVAIVATVASISIDRSRRRAVAAAAAEQQAKQRADANFLKARETVDKWLVGYTEALAHIPVPGVQAVRARMLELAAAQYEGFVADESDDPALALERGRTLVRLGSIYRLLGRGADADDKYQQAQALLNPLRAVAETRDLATTAWAAAGGLRALVAADRGDVPGAEVAFEEVLAAIMPAAKAKPTSPDLLRTLTTLWTNRGGMLAKAGKLDEAAAAFQRAIETGEQWVGGGPEDLEPRRAVVTAEIGAAQVRLLNGDAAGAATLLEKSARFVDAARAIDPNDLQYAQLAVLAHSYLAAANRHQGDADGEQAAYRQAIDAADQLLRAVPDAPALAVQRAMMQTDLGQALLEQFAPTAAEPLLIEAVTTLSRAATAAPTLPEYREALAGALTVLAQAQQALGRYDESLACAVRAADELAALVAAFPDVAIYADRRAAALAVEGMVQVLKGDASLGRARLAEAVAVTERAGATGGPSVDRIHAAAALFARYGDCLAEEDPAASRRWRDRARAEWERLVELTEDPQRACEAAWFLALAADGETGDLEASAGLLARGPSLPANNVRAQLTRAVVAALRNQPAPDRADAGGAEPAFGYAAAIAEARAGRADSAAASWRRAAEWRAGELPGQWDLRMLEAAARRAVEDASGEKLDPPGG